jgi:hypothetical protein
MPGSLTAPRGAGARACAPGRIAFRSTHSVGTSGRISFAAQWLAYALPCRRFAFALTGNDARRGADVDRYSFIAVDLHHLLLAGLPAHAERNPSFFLPPAMGFRLRATYLHPAGYRLRPARPPHDIREPSFPGSLAPC